MPPIPPPRLVRALILTADKTGLVSLAQALTRRGIEILCAGSTAVRLHDAGVKITDIGSHVSGVSGLPDSRTRLLGPYLLGGICGQSELAEPEDATATPGSAHVCPLIDLVVVDLPPFGAARRGPLGRGDDTGITLEDIDMAGPTLIRAAASHHPWVTVVSDPAEYDGLLRELSLQNGGTSAAFRLQHAEAAFARTAAYDADVAAWFARKRGNAFPERLVLSGQKRLDLRYGENPHQEAALYAIGDGLTGLAAALQVQGPQLSFNNIADADTALALVAEFERPAVAIIKHAAPCGVAEADTLERAWEKAFASDPVGAFGSIIAVNRPLDAATAKGLAKVYAEVLAAPDAEDSAREALKDLENLRLLLTHKLPDATRSGRLVKSVSGGLLVQTRDSLTYDPETLQVVTRRQPSEAEMADLLFAYRVAKHVTSTAVVYAKGRATLGIGAGQADILDAAFIAGIKAGDKAAQTKGNRFLTQNGVMAADAFVLFPDGLLAAADAGMTAAIQPGGSVRDEEIIAAADSRDMAMIFTGIRHFRH